MEVTRILAVRHGQTLWNTQLRIQGHTDIDLDSTGRWQADNPAALTLLGRGGQWQVEPGRLRLQAPAHAEAVPVALAWSTLSGQGASQWASSGMLTGLPLSWLALLAHKGFKVLLE